MAIVTEFYRTRRDGVKLYRTYSDEGKHVVREDGAVFEEAVDVENSGHIYTEGEPLPEEESPDNRKLAEVV